MATYLENLTTARAQIAERLVEVTSQPKPNYSVDGESYSWAEYMAQLQAQLEQLDKAIQRASGPFMVKTRGWP